jgi:hypothetical protein
MMLEQFLSHVERSQGVWFSSLSDVFDRWRDASAGN